MSLGFGYVKMWAPCPRKRQSFGEPRVPLSHLWQTPFSFSLLNRRRTIYVTMRASWPWLQQSVGHLAKLWETLGNSAPNLANSYVLIFDKKNDLQQHVGLLALGYGKMWASWPQQRQSFGKPWVPLPQLYQSLVCFSLIKRCAVKRGPLGLAYSRVLANPGHICPGFGQNGFIFIVEQEKNDLGKMRASWPWLWQDSGLLA